MWTATPHAPTLDPDGSGNTLVVVDFTNGTITKSMTFRGVDQAQLIQQSQGALALFEHLDSEAAFVANPDLTQITDPVQPALTQAQKDMQNFMQWNSIASGVAAAKTLGWITGAEAPVTAAGPKYKAAAGAVFPVLFP